jgi:hypothetical protein
MKTSRLSLFLCALSACAAQVDDGTLSPDAAEDAEDVALGELAQGLIGPNDVGVLAPENMNCPNEHIVLVMENERDSNRNDADGWLGASTQDSAFTKLHFCRVDGRSFHPVRGTNTDLNYAVLKLGDTCPAGSVELVRRFDDEDRPRACPPRPLACAGGNGAPGTLGDFTPNSYDGNNLHLNLCMFRASTSGALWPMPHLVIPYGVFGTGALPSLLATGSVHTDDEDDSNANWLSGDVIGSEAFLTPGGNTDLRFAEVNPPSRIIHFPPGQVLEQ